jgi:Domain of unknown function (DUF4249)
MVMKSVIAYIIIALTISTSGCVETVEYNLSKENERMVISAQLTDLEGLQQVRISKSVLLDKDAKVEEEVISNAEVSIIFDGGVIPFTYINNGIYSTDNFGMPNMSYKLRVLIDGKTYESSYETMPAKPTQAYPASEAIDIETLTTAGNIVREKKVQLTVDGPIRNDEYFLFRSRGEYEFREYQPMSTTNKSCYVSTNLDQGEVNLISAEKLKANDFLNYPILFMVPDNRLFTNFCFHITQFNINKNAYEYWNRLDQVLTTGNGLFQAPPGKLTGNIKNINDEKEEVLGYFTVGAAVEFRHFTNVTKLGIQVPDPCGFNFNRPRPQECSECLTLQNSSDKKPTYWP